MRLMKFKTSPKGPAQWGLLEQDTVHPLKGMTNIAGIFSAAHKRKHTAARGINISGVIPLPPAEERSRVFCAGLNYRDHAAEIRMPVPKSPVFFTKTSGALCGALDNIVKPGDVRLLDYEVELAFIVGRTIGKKDILTPGNLGEYFLGIAIFNDISARDIQLAAGQWFLGKTYRGFAPVGPVLQVLDDVVIDRLYRLSLELHVLDPAGNLYENKHQSGSTADMVFRTHELANCLSARFDLLPGDIIASGTPRGVALSHPSKLQVRIAEILGIPPAERIRKFIEKEVYYNTKYLQAGDVISAHIRSDDGRVNLGEQRNAILLEK